MKGLWIRLVTIIITACLLIPIPVVSAENDAVSITMSCVGSPYAGGEIALRVTVRKPVSALAGIEFVLSYDPDSVTPTVTKSTEDGGEMDVLIKTAPKGWEQMSYHSEGYYHFRFAMPDTVDEYLDADGELVLEIPFAVDKAGEFLFEIADADVIAIAASDLTPMTGKGASLPVVAASEAQKLAIGISSGEIAYEGSLYYLKLDATNLGDENGIIGLEFDLFYDKSSFAPTVTDNKSEQMNSFMKSMPQDSWEQMCSLDADKGCYTIRLAALHAESLTECESLVSGSRLTLSIPFRVIASEGSIADFYVDTSSVIALNGKNKIVSGSGSAISVSIEKATESMIPEHLGYEIKGNYLLNVSELTEVAEFLAPLSSYRLTDSDGNMVMGGYVCTGYVLTDGETALTVIVRGDGDRSGTVDTYDYVLARRVYFATFSPSPEQLLALALTNGTSVTTYDYILIRRHFFGTVDLNKV